MVSKNNTEINTSTNGLFISGLPYETTEEELRELFEQYGEIKILKLPKYQDSGRNIGYCHIYFDQPESAEKAMEWNKHKIGKRYIIVERARHDVQEWNSSEKINTDNVPSDCWTAFVKNLPYEITEKEVGDKFRSCGRINGVRFVYNSMTKHFKGFCYIDFKEHKSLLKALELNGKEWNGRTMKVDFEVGHAKKGYKYKNDEITPEYNREQVKLLSKKRKNEK